MIDEKPRADGHGLHTFMIPMIDRSDAHSDIALVARVKDGDGTAFELIVRQHARQVFTFAQRITKCREDAEDVTQEVFLKAFGKIHEFQGRSKLSTWLVRIAVNESLMRLRRKKCERRWALDEDLFPNEKFVFRELPEFRPNPEQLYDQAELSNILLQSIHGLPPEIRTVFTLRDVENLSTKETAELLGLTIPAVKTRLLRARIKLRNCLQDGFNPQLQKRGDHAPSTRTAKNPKSAEGKRQQ